MLAACCRKRGREEHDHGGGGGRRGEAALHARLVPRLGAARLRFCPCMIDRQGGIRYSDKSFERKTSVRARPGLV